MHNHLTREIRALGDGCPACDAYHVRNSMKHSMDFKCSCDMFGGCPSGCQQCMVCFGRDPEEQESPESGRQP